ncbi:MAG TPA: DUF1254 domain-containing protein [Candidatus Binataceae bacterium]|nr:DUF1254 domain-containing protein [Candidatus Binataceae bacterium]
MKRSPSASVVSFAARVAALAFVLITLCRPEAMAQQAAPHLSADEARAIATDAYIYGYPLVTMEYTRRVMTNVAEPEGTRAPMGQLVRARSYPTAAFRDVTAPNADTLYTAGWIDVSKQPYVLSIPDARGRYYLMPMLDAWTDVFQVPGKRTTGSGPQTYAITGPNWTGTLPSGVTEYKSPTALVWILGRIYCTGTAKDYAAVHEMEDRIKLVPLGSYGKPYTPPAGTVDPGIDMKTAVREQVNALDAAAYFNLMAQLMKNNPPTADDAAIVARIAKIGIVPGQSFDLTRLSPDAQQAVKGVPKAAFGKIMGHFKNAGKFENGWVFTTKTGVYTTDYLDRALITAIGLGANRPQDAVYPTSEVDVEGQPYSGANQYIMHFNKGGMPPVNGFWSLTMYDARYFFVANPLNRYTLSARNKLKHNADGSVDLYLQNENPGKARESNWLPAPKGKFILMLRLYWPKENPPSLLDGTWTIPGVKQVR